MATSPLFSNNAPPPIPGGWGNPTGANTGVAGKSAAPNISMPLYNAGSFSGTDFAHLNTGFDAGNFQTKFSNLLGKSYGQGAGQILTNIFQKGLFNPDVAAAFLNSMRPAEARGQADILSSFGAEGSRFGSAAALGLGDYLSQVNLNEQSTLASLFENAQGQELSLLGSVLPTLQKERANSGGLVADILGGLEAVGGAIAAPFTGGATIPLIGAGISTIAGANSGGSQPQQPSSSSLQGLLGAFGKAPDITAGSPMSAGQPQDAAGIIQMLQSISGGNVFGPTSLDGGSSDPNNDMLMQLLSSGMLVN